MKSEKSDYLKYWRAVRQYMKVKNGVSQSDLDIILFLYTEPYFSREKFNEFNRLLSWDKQRFDKLCREGWIESYKTVMFGRRKKYGLSYKSMRMINSIYKILDGEEIPTTVGVNPMFKKNVKYTDKVYRHFIMEMRKATTRQQRPSPEL